jgi:hypothetical protein
MSVQVVPSAAEQRIIVKFLTDENMVVRFRVHFGDGTLSRTLVYDWSESMRRLHLLQGNLWSVFFLGGGDSQGVLPVDFLIEQ